MSSIKDVGQFQSYILHLLITQLIINNTSPPLFNAHHYTTDVIRFPSDLMFSPPACGWKSCIRTVIYDETSKLLILSFQRYWNMCYARITQTERTC